VVHIHRPPGGGQVEPAPEIATVASEIVALTRVVSDAAQAAPGKLVNLEVILGVLPAIPTFSQLVASPVEAVKTFEPGESPQPGDVGGTLTSTSLPSVDETFQHLQITPTGGLPTTLDGTVTADPTGTLTATLLSTVDGVVATVSHAVEVQVQYIVRREGEQAPLKPNRDYQIFGSALAVGILLMPRFVDDTVLATATRYFIQVEVDVRVHLPGPPDNPGVESSTAIGIPVVMPNVPVPSVFVYGANPSFAPGDERLVLMVRRRSELKTIGEVISVLNGVLEVLAALRGLFYVAGFLVDGLEVLAELVAMTPRATISVGDIPDLEDHDDLRSQQGAALLFGVSGTAIRLFDDTGFEDKTFDIVVPGPATSGLVQLNVGYRYVPDVAREWNGNTAESVRWIDQSIDVTPLRLQMP
jgi:hypothetical protein